MTIRFLITTVLALAGTLLTAQEISGIFRGSDAKMEYAEQMTWEQFVTANRKLNARGYRLNNIETTGQADDRRFWGIYIESSLRDTLIKTENWADFVKEKRTMAAAGYLLTNVQAYAISELDAHYIGVWYKDNTDTPHKIWKLDSPESLRQRTEDMAAQNYYIQEVEVYLTPSGTANYLAVYHYSLSPVRNYVFITSDHDEFHKDLWQRQQSKVRLVDFERFNAKEAAYLLGVYQPGIYDNQFLFQQLREDFNGKWEQLEKSNLKLVSWEVRD